MVLSSRRPFLLLTALLTGIALITAGCGDDDPDGARGSAPGPEKITYLTAFGAAGRDAFAWIAQQQGYFRDANLEVTIELGKASGENLKALASGKAQFAATDLTAAMISADPKTPNPAAYKDFRAILGIHQQTLVSLMALQGSGITSPRDLAGKRIAAAANSVNQLLFPGYAKLAGIDAGSIRWVNVQPATLGPVLASGKADALSTFLIGLPTIEKATKQAKKVGVVVFPYSYYLPALFGNAVLTTSGLIAEKPDLVKRMSGALRQALVYTVAHPDEAAELLHQKQPETIAAVAAQEIRLMKPSVVAEGQDRIGTIGRDRIAGAITSLRDAGLIGTALKPENVVAFDVVPAG